MADDDAEAVTDELVEAMAPAADAEEEATSLATTEDEQAAAREITQTDHLNKRLLASFLQSVQGKSGNEIMAMFNAVPPTAGEDPDAWPEEEDDEQGEEPEHANGDALDAATQR